MDKNSKHKKCPMCDGKGHIGRSKKLSPVLKDAHVKEANRLKKDGYTLRQIAAYLGYDHPQSVANLLNPTHSKKTNTQ